MEDNVSPKTISFKLGDSEEPSPSRVPVESRGIRFAADSAPPPNEDRTAASKEPSQIPSHDSHAGSGTPQPLSPSRGIRFASGTAHPPTKPPSPRLAPDKATSSGRTTTSDTTADQDTSSSSGLRLQPIAEPPAPDSSAGSLYPTSTSQSSPPQEAAEILPPLLPPSLSTTDSLSSFLVSPTDSSTSHRAIRTISHINFPALQSEAEAEAKRLRTYLVATDLSDAAAYALEWTVSKFLRDGDTLLAIYAVEAGSGAGGDRGRKAAGSGSRSGRASQSRSGRETPGSGRDTPTAGTETPTCRKDSAVPTGRNRSESNGGSHTRPVRAGSVGGIGGVSIGGGAAAMLDAQATIRRLNSFSSAASLQASANGNGLGENGEGLARRRSVSEVLAAADALGEQHNPKSKAEKARLQVIDKISQTCLRALRRTTLKVQVAIEVIHAKSPKHMITEAIDTLEPTLVILGSRGRSALKGVLLGSFSNYLVTKSSVPVVVAKKRLIKPKEPMRAALKAAPGNAGQNRLVSAKVE